MALITLIPTPARFVSHGTFAAGRLEVRCTSCSVRHACLADGVRAEDLEEVQNIVYTRKRLKRGQALFRGGDDFASVYAVRYGFFKTSLVDDVGREQVTGFFMGGELLGIDGLASGTHGGTAVALEDSEVCVMPYSFIESMGREYPALQRHLRALLAREIVRGQGVMMLLGSARAEERIAAFLSDLSDRYRDRGQCASEFRLRMSRAETASYLGLTLETVSRLFSKLQDDGIIAVKGRHFRILDIVRLRKTAAASRSRGRAGPPCALARQRRSPPSCASPARGGPLP